MVERERVHRARRGRARRDLHDSRAQPDALGVRADPRERRERVGAPRLGRPHRVEAEPLRLLCERDRERIGLRAPVAELQAEFHSSCVLPAAPDGHDGIALRQTEPMPQRFEGVIGRDWRDSTPWWPPEPEPPAGAPNVLLIVLDDVGYAQLGCYGSDIDTPTIDGLAADGIRLANFHTTALCSPTRACLLTGRNHHRSGMGRVADLAMGYPGYWGMVPRENGFLSEILRAQGYASYAVGKWHLTPDDETSMAASPRELAARPRLRPVVRIPRRRDTPVRPALFHDNHAVLAPGSYEDGYHLSADLADRAIEFLADLRAVDEEQPVLLLPRDRRVPLAAPRAARMDRALPRPLRPRAGTRGATRPSPASSRWGCCPRTRALAPAALGPRVGHALARRPGGGRALHGVLRRVPLVHRRADRRGCSTTCARPATSTTRSSCSAPTTARAPKAARGLAQRRALLQRRRQRSPRAARTHRRARRPDHPQQLPVGLDHGRQHALQALEARGARRWRRRSVHRAPRRPGARRLGGRDPPPVRPRHRRAADRARAGRHRGARCRRRRRRSRPIDGDELRLPAGRGRRRPAATRPSTSRCSAPARSTTTVGRR